MSLTINLIRGIKHIWLSKSFSNNFSSIVWLYKNIITIYVLLYNFSKKQRLRISITRILILNINLEKSKNKSFINCNTSTRYLWKLLFYLLILAEFTNKYIYLYLKKHSIITLFNCLIPLFKIVNKAVLQKIIWFIEIAWNKDEK